MIWIGEYSATQDAFHVQPLAAALAENLRRARRRDRSNDWVAVAVGREEHVRAVITLLQTEWEGGGEIDMAGEILREMGKDIVRIGPGRPKLKHLHLVSREDECR